MALPVTSLYAVLSTILYLTLAVGVIRKRRELKIPYGDGGQRLLIKRIAVGACVLFLVCDIRSRQCRNEEMQSRSFQSFSNVAHYLNAYSGIFL